MHLGSGEGTLQWLIGATWLQFDQRQDIRVQSQIPVGFLVPGQSVKVPLPGGAEFLLGGADVGAAVENLRGKPGEDVGRRFEDDLGHAGVLLDLAGGRGEVALVGEVLGKCDAVFQSGHVSKPRGESVNAGGGGP